MDSSSLHREYFEDVDRTWETFEKTLWGHITNFFKLAKERCIFFLLRAFAILCDMTNDFIALCILLKSRHSFGSLDFGLTRLMEY